MQNEHKDNFFAYVNKELELNGFNNSDLGKIMTQYLQEVYKMTSGDKHHMLMFIDMLSRLVERQPLSELKEEEIIGEGVYSKHPRYEWIQKLPDDTYIDQRGIGFINKNGNKWYGKNEKYNSVIPITFPYYPQEKIVNTEE